MAGYGSDQGLTDWLAANGYTLPVDAPTPAVLRERGSVYVDSLGSAPAGAYEGYRWAGFPTGGYAQERAWARTGVMVGNQAVPDDVIPSAIEKASYVAAYQDAINPGSLTASGSASTAVKREKVDVIEVEYATSSSATSGSYADSIIPVNTTIMGLIRPFLIDLAQECVGIWSIGLRC